jgi:hypothetical protein
MRALHQQQHVVFLKTKGARVFEVFIFVWVIDDQSLLIELPDEVHYDQLADALCYEQQDPVCVH